MKSAEPAKPARLTAGNGRMGNEISEISEISEINEINEISGIGGAKEKAGATKERSGRKQSAPETNILQGTSAWPVKKHQKGPNDRLPV